MVNVVLAQSQSSQDVEKERFKKEAEEIYKSVDIGGIVPFADFYKGYVGYFKFRNQLNGTPIISFLNYSVPNTQERFVTVDFKQRKVLYLTHAAHGVNSSAADQSGRTPCSQTESRVDENGRSHPACPWIRGVPAVAFSNTLSSYQSSKGFIMAAETNYSRVVTWNLKLKGLETDLNGLLYNRGVVFHPASYPSFGGLSLGCIAVPQNKFDQGFQLLRGNTLIYAFEGSTLRSNSGTDVDNQDLERAVESNKNPNFAQSPDVANVKPTRPDFSETSLSQSTPSLGAIALGVVAVGGAVALMSGSSSKNSPPPTPSTAPAVVNTSAGSVETLKGSAKYEQCQQLSDTSWKETVAHINSGGNPSDRFKGSWQELNQTIINNSIENGPAVELAEKRLATINDCVAMAHVSSRTDFNKPNINSPEKKSSADGSITCVYNGPESQDYQACLKAIAAHDALMKAEADAHAKQEANYKASAEKRVGQVNGNNAQAKALEQASGLLADHSQVAQERAEISQAKIDHLAAVAAQIPTTDSLYDECTARFTKHGTVSINEYNEFAGVFMAEAKPFQAERDYCLSAVSRQVNPLHNQPAREEIKKVLKSFGKEMQEYASKSSNLLQKTAQTPAIDDSLFGLDVAGHPAGYSAFGSNHGEDDFASVLSFDNGARSSGLDKKGFPIVGSPFDKGDNSLGVNSASVGVGRGFSGSDYALSTSGATVESRVKRTMGNSISGGIYDEEFYRKINLALQNPDQLDSLQLSPDQMREYLDRKHYYDSLSRGADTTSKRAPASAETVEFKDKVEGPISDKELNIFEIISSRYAKKFNKL